MNVLCGVSLWPNSSLAFSLISYVIVTPAAWTISCKVDISITKIYVIEVLMHKKKVGLYRWDQYYYLHMRN